MDNLFQYFTKYEPDYNSKHLKLFDNLSKKLGAKQTELVNLGKHFKTFYELYIFSFFLGLYSEKPLPLPSDKSKRKTLRYAIQLWGENNDSARKEYTQIQHYIFMALVAKTDINLIDLDKGEIEIIDLRRQLTTTLESYANGGLEIITEKLENNTNAFLDPSSFLREIKEAPSNIKRKRPRVKADVSEKVEIEGDSENIN